MATNADAAAAVLLPDAVAADAARAAARERRRAAAAESRLQRRLLRLYADIGVNPAMLAVQPPIAPRLAAVRAVIARVYPEQVAALPLDPLILLRHSGDPDAPLLLNIYAKIDDTRVRDFVPIEALALAAGVPVHRIADILMSSLCRLSHEVATMVTAFGHLQVVEDTLATARMLGPDGDTARSQVHKAVGWLPAPKGSVTNIFATANATAAPQTAVVLPPSPEQTIRQLAERRVAEQGTLPAADVVPVDVATDADAVDAEFDDADEGEE